MTSEKPYLHPHLNESRLSPVDFRVLAHLHRVAKDPDPCTDSALDADQIDNFQLNHLDKLTVPRWIDAAGLTPNEFRIFYYVTCKETPDASCTDSIKKISRFTEMKRPHAQSAVDILVEKGYLYRDGDSGLRAICHAPFTPKNPPCERPLILTTSIAPVSFAAP